MNKALEDIAISVLTKGQGWKDLPDPDMILYWRQLEQRELWLDEAEITWDTTAFIAQYIQYLNKTESDDMTPITLHIMSPGGHLHVMFALYDIIKASKIPVITINEGICHSAAFVIFLAGDVRKMNPNAVFCAHEGSGGMGGTYRESKAAMREYEIEVEQMKNIISQETGMPLDFINQKFEQNSDWYIRQGEAKELGILKDAKE